MTPLKRIQYKIEPVTFAREALGFDADEKQKLVLGADARRVMLCCSRQWGKSTITALAMLHRAHFFEGSEIVVVSPSGRQSAELVRKVRRFAAVLGMSLRGDEAPPGAVSEQHRRTRPSCDQAASQRKAKVSGVWGSTA